MIAATPACAARFRGHYQGTSFNRIVALECTAITLSRSTAWVPPSQCTGPTQRLTHTLIALISNAPAPSSTGEF